MNTQRGARMTVDYEAAVKSAKRYADDVRRVMPVAKAVLFGSYAKGAAAAPSPTVTPPSNFAKVV